MEKGFIKRLTDEQIRTFIERKSTKQQVLSYEFMKIEDIIPRIIVDYELAYWKSTCTLLEYEAMGEMGSSREWRKYLYEIFGEEYKQAYLDHCSSIFI